MIKKFRRHLRFPIMLLIVLPGIWLLIRLMVGFVTDLILGLVSPLYSVDWTNPKNLGILLVCAISAVIILYATIMTALDTFIEMEVHATPLDKIGRAHV